MVNYFPWFRAPKAICILLLRVGCGLLSNGFLKKLYFESKIFIIIFRQKFSRSGLSINLKWNKKRQLRKKNLFERFFRILLRLARSWDSCFSRSQSKSLELYGAIFHRLLIIAYFCSLATKSPFKMSTYMVKTLMNSIFTPYLPYITLKSVFTSQLALLGFLQWFLSIHLPYQVSCFQDYSKPLGDRVPFGPVWVWAPAACVTGECFVHCAMPLRQIWRIHAETVFRQVIFYGIAMNRWVRLVSLVISQPASLY